ncbi:MAG: lytic transglycosylase domain-containing protein [Deltaproteobacteria bacterium]|nr:lytic transglycosylase domain-containing protein [Deltaproteobacteria bacterium]
MDAVLALAVALAAGDRMYLSIGKDGVPVVTDFPRAEAVDYQPGDFERIALRQKGVAHRGLGAARTALDRPAPAAPGIPPEIDELVDWASRRHQLPPSLLLAVMAVESGFRVDAVSPAGALGLMQLMPATAADLGVKNPLDARENVDGGARYLAFLRKHFKSDELALAAYNAGPGRVARVGGVPDIPETKAYIESVLGLAASYEAGPASR